MKLSYNWIKKYVELPEDLTMAKLSYDLTMSTVEVEDAVSLAESLGGLVIGRILTVEPHPDADKLRICTVDTGDIAPSVIVCGGINLYAGEDVVVAKPGAWVKWHGEGDPVEIKPAKLRGVMSFGMICSSGEVGLAELFPAEHAEIMDLTDFHAKPGTPVADALDLNDIILEIDNKSMTNRPDLWGHYGMARELAAIYKCRLKPIDELSLPELTETLKVDIEAPERCSRYIGIVIDGVKSVPSPFALKSLLWRVGIRSVSLPVDITNYVMLACGQPTHGFDRSHINGGITVRKARACETLQLLDGEDLELTQEDLVIADDKAPAALAGVMGGRLDSILPDTKEIVLEIASFDALSIRRTSQRFDVRTEASARYEKSIDPQRADAAASIAAEAFAEYFPESKIKAYTDNYPRPLKNAEVDVDMDFLRRRLGKDLSAEEVTQMLSLLGFKTVADGTMLHVTAPSWRSTGDISLPDDILEETARLMGYENFEFKAPTVVLDKAVNQKKPDLERAVREYLAFRCNMQEIFTYPWIEDEYIKAAGIPEADMLQLSTPPAPEESHLRSSLVPGLLKAVTTNLRYFTDFKVFEMTQVFLDRNYSSPSGTDEMLPEMARHLGAALVGSDARQLFREAKGVLQYMHRAAQMEPLGFSQTAKPDWADEKLWVNVTRGTENIGTLALVSPKSAKAAGIKRGLAVIFEIDAEKLEALPSRQNKFEHLPEYPLSDFDLSIIFDEGVAWADIENIVKKVDLVKKVMFVDEYRGTQVGEGKKSVSFRVWIGSDKGTLTSEQIETASKQTVKKIGKKFGGDVRGA